MSRRCRERSSSMRLTTEPPEARHHAGGNKQLDEIGNNEGKEARRERRSESACRGDEQRQPGDAACEDHGKSACQRTNCRDIPPIESTLGEPAADERRKRIGHEVSAG